jgi:hypothetical protein
MIECVGGPLDGSKVGDRGHWWRPMVAGWTGTYARDGAIYRWEAD